MTIPNLPENLASIEIDGEKWVKVTEVSGQLFGAIGMIIGLRKRLQLVQQHVGVGLSADDPNKQVAALLDIQSLLSDLGTSGLIQ